MKRAKKKSVKEIDKFNEDCPGASPVAGLFSEIHFSREDVESIVKLKLFLEKIDKEINRAQTILSIEKKVAHSAVKQRFQADAITGDLLKIGEQPFESDLQGREKTFFAIPHMPHIEGISVEEINQQLMGTDLTKYEHYQGEILNANVDTIKGVECIGLEYIRAYLVKMQGIDSPFIISYKYDASKKGFNERFRWQPMRMPCEKAYTEYGFSRDIECYSDQSLKTINENLEELEKTLYTQEDLDRLENLDNFRPSAIDHIFKGEINGRGQATGYHYEGIEDSPGKTVEGTKSDVDDNGVYTAQVEVNDIPKTGNGGESTFYPEEMSPQEVIDAINEAYDNRVNLRGNTYVGESDGGLQIEMYLDADDKIISAFPIYEGDE